MPRGATGGRVLNVRAAAAAGVSNNVCSVRFRRLRQVQGHADAAAAAAAAAVPAAIFPLFICLSFFTIVTVKRPAE